MTTETPKQEAFRLTVEAQEAEIYERILVAVRAKDVEVMRRLNDELVAMNAERAHFNRWHGPDATFDDSYAARTR